MITLKIQDVDGNTRFVSRGEREVGLVYTAEYKEGDFVSLAVDHVPAYVWVQVDEALGKSLVYLTDPFYFTVPFGEKHVSYPPKAFRGERHYLYARYASDAELAVYRNLAENVNDQHEDKKCYPHASANVETRGEAVFAARNAIDGITENHSHGEWPYTSWGINRRDDAWIKIDFGRTVRVDKVVLYERADFPHDNWWKRVSLHFSDGEKLVCELKKTDEGQEIVFREREISWLMLEELIKSEEPSPFPALTQIQVFGREIG